MATKKTASRGRDASRTAADLIDSARWLFSRHAYDSLGTRDIAERAGVDAALVHRYFGTKKKLFAKAIEDAYLIVHQVDDCERSALPARFAALMIDAKKDPSGVDATMLLVRSAASEEVRTLLSAALDEDFITPLAQHLGGERWRTRAALTLGILAGFDLLRRVLKIDALNGPDAKVLLERALRACLVDGS